MEANGGSIFRAGSVQKILDAGYMDSLYDNRSRAAADHGTFSTQFPGQRVDYIFSFGFAVNASAPHGSSRIALPSTPAIISRSGGNRQKVRSAGFSPYF